MTPQQQHMPEPFPYSPRNEPPHAPLPQPSHAPPSSADDGAIRQAIDHLASSERNRDAAEEPAGEQLVLEEDKMLLTSYFYYLMKQLQVCRFSEQDRKTRGGKRENVAIGYGGLQCIHCAGAGNSRKFFWSNVDRLANSFAEIPSHILKCRRCPEQTKSALMDLKRKHPQQMSSLPRGSQKVFFRRMWRRLHDNDPVVPPVKQEDFETGAPTAAALPTGGPDSPTEPSGELSASTSGEDSTIILERSTKEAAKALAATQQGPPSPSSRVLLAIPDDKEWLSDMDCFVRRNLEVFCATEGDVEQAQMDRKHPVTERQVGIRCIHCALTKEGAHGSAVAYPLSVSGIYESVREFQRVHLESCHNLPSNTKAKLESFKGATSLSSVLRKYYILSGKALGMYDTADEGIRCGAEAEPLGPTAAFAFSESEEGTPPESRKRKDAPSSQGNSPPGSEAKRSAH